MTTPRHGALVARAVQDLEQNGYAVVDGLADTSDMAALTGDLAPHFAAIDLADAGNQTKRVHSRVLASSPTLQHLVAHPVLLGVLDVLLGPNCVRYQISSVQGIEVHPGASDQNLHRDDDIFRLAHPHPCFEVNMMWAVTDFTAENGATRVIPGSHRLASGKEPDPADAIPAEMTAGSILLWQGATWHGAGANTTDNPRIGLYTGYSLGWLRQEEMMYLALPPASVRAMPEKVQRLIGYELKGTHTLGWLDGRDPRTVLGLDG